jgi:hypothetical protein
VTIKVGQVVYGSKDDRGPHLRTAGPCTYFKSRDGKLVFRAYFDNPTEWTAIGTAADWPTIDATITANMAKSGQ